MNAQTKRSTSERIFCHATYMCFRNTTVCTRVTIVSVLRSCRRATKVCAPCFALPLSVAFSPGSSPRIIPLQDIIATSTVSFRVPSLYVSMQMSHPP
jgi:hypothetical protein